ncbi:hypothetical protein BDN71DRAFT_1344290, partial [Pleurotus eryngii]
PVAPAPIREIDMADQTHSVLANRKRQPNKELQPRPKPVPYQSELSAQIPEGQVINTILDTHVNLPVRQLLGTSRELTEELFSLMKYRNNKPPEVNKLTAEVHSYSMADHNCGPLLRLPLTYNGKAVSAIIDTGSELNVINRKVFQDLIALPYDPNEVLTMTDANGGRGELRGFVQNVPIAWGDIVTRANFYIGDQGGYDMLLGIPWQIANKVSIEHKEDGTYIGF